VDWRSLRIAWAAQGVPTTATFCMWWVKTASLRASKTGAHRYCGPIVSTICSTVVTTRATGCSVHGSRSSITTPSSKPLERPAARMARITSLGAPENTGPRARAAVTRRGSISAQRSSRGQDSTQSWVQNEQLSSGVRESPSSLVRFCSTGCRVPGSHSSTCLEQAATHSPHPAQLSSDQTSASKRFDITTS